tara:strand:+ start:367 stop:1386 length:1020 start_codon:yes stop_codon:yes gene_type:complete
MSSFYSVGLGNVGSYQVSGRPWLKWYSASAGEVKLFGFPSVTSKISIQNLTASTELLVAFAEPKRAIDFSSTNEYLTSTFSSVDQFTVSAWIKLDGTIANLRLLQMTGGVDFRLQTTGTPRLRLIVNGTTETDATTTLLVGNWINVTVTSNGTSNKAYLNGQLLIENTGDAAGGFTGLDIGGSGIVGYDGIYDELALFSTALNDAEVLELYNSGKTLETTDHSRASDLVSRWDFEDNNYKAFYSTADTTTLIYDRASSNNLSLAGGSLTPLTFVDGRLIENAFDRHKITLSGASEINIECKTKQILIKAVAALDLNIKASLTSIPSSRMYDLTGPGIDE